MLEFLGSGETERTIIHRQVAVTECVVRALCRRLSDGERERPVLYDLVVRATVRSAGGA